MESVLARCELPAVRPEGSPLRYLVLVVACLLATRASAAPILDVLPSPIAPGPTQTVITFQVTPNGTPLSSLVLNFSALATGLWIVSIAAVDPEVTMTGPALSGGDWLAGFAAAFGTNRSAPFVVGTLTLEGLVPGTPLVATGNFTDAGFGIVPIGPTDVAAVVPEPASLALLAIGLLGLRAFGRPLR